MKSEAFLSRLMVVALLLFTGGNRGVWAQRFELNDENGLTMNNSTQPRDSAGSNKEVPRGMTVWTVDERFGDRTMVVVDTVPHMFMNTVFTTGLRGEYNTTGNLGSPRESRIFADRQPLEQFMFTQPYDYFIISPGAFHFTNTYSPITNLSYNSCGDKNNGEDHLKALFAVNANKRLGLGFKFDYLYGRGIYQNQSTAHFNYSLYGSYLGDRYEAHLLFSTNHQKVAENGGITNDNYVSHPEIYLDDFRADEIPTVLQENWNRNDNQHIFLTHRYSIGFNRKVPMTDQEIAARKFAIASEKEKKAQNTPNEPSAGRPENAGIAGEEPSFRENEQSRRIAVTSKAMADSLKNVAAITDADTTWTKDEYVPVTSFIHTMHFDNYKRIYQAYTTPNDYYSNTFLDNERLKNDSIYDLFKHYELKNTLSISLLEGFNKWAKAGLKGFVTSDLRHFSMPDTAATAFQSYNEHNLSVGGQLIKTQGSLLHYNATAETWLVGKDAGQLKVDAAADLNFSLFGDTVRLDAKAHFYRLNPTFFQRIYHSKHLWWDNSDKLSKEIRTRIEGRFTYEKTRTSVRVVADNLQNYTYFAQKFSTISTDGRSGNSVEVRQSSSNISLLTLQLTQDFTLGPLNWESQLTYQKCTSNSVLPVPTLNVYTNLYLHFKIAHVLTVDLGADMRFFTKYEAPDYSPLIGQFCVQDNGELNVKTGNYPIINAYANMHLKRTRFFVMMSHVNDGDGGNSFLTPHYPINGRLLRLGVSWNFTN